MNQENPIHNNSPALRFSEFTEGWVRKKLGDVATFSKGKGISKADISEDGINECIRYGELYTFYGETINEIKSKTNINIKDLVLSEANDVIIPASGETQIDIATASCVLKKGIALGGDLNIIKTKNNGVFLSYYLKSKRKFDIANLAQGISVVHLYSSQLATLNLNLPSLNEQQKIATFFTAIDKKLNGLKEQKSLLETYKKGVMQQLFTVDTDGRPYLRFKNTEGGDFADWEEKRLGECLDYLQPTNYLVSSTEYNDSYKTPVLTAGKTFILGYTNEGSGIFKENLPVIIFDDFTTTTQFVDFPFKAKSSAMKILIAKENVNIKFMFESMKIMKYEIGGHERHWISKFAQMVIMIPCLEEQTRIATYLTALDAKIQTVSAQIAQTETWKKGLLQKMFV